MARKLTKKMVDSLVYEGAVSGRGTKGKPNGELTITPATGNHNPPPWLATRGCRDSRQTGALHCGAESRPLAVFVSKVCLLKKTSKLRNTLTAKST